MRVKAKKHLGQHFLKDTSIAADIANLLTYQHYEQVLEIGPGTGVLTQFLKPENLYVIEIDRESIAYLQQHFPALEGRIIAGDFLKIDIPKLFKKPIAVIGNFPYHISSQIVFKVIENRYQIPEMVGMFQKEVAERIAASPGSKKYGILSVLTQTFYEAEYMFTVPPHVFTPPPKVDSGVVKLTRKENLSLPVDEEVFRKVVKTAFNQRRKVLKNSLKSMLSPEISTEDTIFARRPEQLSVEDFIQLTRLIATTNMT